MEDEEEYGCEWCQNDMPLKDDGHCPKCDAWYPDDKEFMDALVRP